MPYSDPASLLYIEVLQMVHHRSKIACGGNSAPRWLSTSLQPCPLYRVNVGWVATFLEKKNIFPSNHRWNAHHFDLYSIWSRFGHCSFPFYSRGRPIAIPGAVHVCPSRAFANWDARLTGVLYDVDRTMHAISAQRHWMRGADAMKQTPYGMHVTKEACLKPQGRNFFRESK